MSRPLGLAADIRAVEAFLDKVVRTNAVYPALYPALYPAPPAARQ